MFIRDCSDGLSIRENTVVASDRELDQRLRSRDDDRWVVDIAIVLKTLPLSKMFDFVKYSIITAAGSDSSVYEQSSAGIEQPQALTELIRHTVVGFRVVASSNECLQAGTLSVADDFRSNADIGLDGFDSDIARQWLPRCSRRILGRINAGICRAAASRKTRLDHCAAVRETQITADSDWVTGVE